MAKLNNEDSHNSNFSPKKLCISKNKIFLGVLGGISEYLSVDATFLRLIFIFFVVFTGFFPGVLLYLIAAVLIPKE